jgi:hypothetical protein
MMITAIVQLALMNLVLLVSSASFFGLFFSFFRAFPQALFFFFSCFVLICRAGEIDDF